MNIEIAEKLLTCRTENELKSKFKSLINEIGISKYGYFCFSSNSSLPKIVSDYPQTWVNRYIESNYASVDPTVKISLATSIPFTWEYARELLPQTELLQQYWSEADSFNLMEGVSLSIPDSHDFTGFGFSLSNMKDSQQWLTHHYNELIVLANLFHFKLNRLNESSIESEIRSNISAREIECAQWLSSGLTAECIAKKMNISERTVRYHLGQLKAKLNLSTKEQVIALLAYRKVIKV
ncbi:LuxR family transcriptional regulator [Shewanella sp. 125m-1]